MHLTQASTKVISTGPSSLSQTRADTNTSTPKKWTVMVYMAGDNSLEYFGVEDMNELELAGSSDEVNILVQFDRHPNGNINNGYTDSNGDWSDTRRFYIEHDKDSKEFYNYTQDENMWILGELNMASELTFKNFLHWSLGNYSAEHYLLVMWDHGEGIFSNGRGGSAASTDQGSTTTKTKTKTNTRGICNDESDGGWLDLWEMQRAFEEIKTTYNSKIDIISFDICWIGTLEAAYEFIPYADYFTGSPEEEPNPGWDYYGPIGYLVSNPTISAAELAIMISDEFKEQYKAETSRESKYITYASVDLNRFDKYLIPLINNFADVLSSNIVDNYSVISKARTNSMAPERRKYMRDLFHFADLIAFDTNASPAMRSAANAINVEYNQTIIRFVHGSGQPDARGPTIYFPDNSYNQQYISKLSFSAEHWDDFLELFLTPIQIRHTPLNDSEDTTGVFEIKASIESFDLDENNIYLFFLEDKSGMKIPVQMSKTGNDLEYSGKIRIDNYDTIVHYYIRTQEQNFDGTYICSPQDVDEGDIDTWYSFNMANDTVPPVIVHDQNNDVAGTFGEPYNFYVNITDNLGLAPETLYLHYNINNTEWFTDIMLQPTTATNPDRYNCTIPNQSFKTIIYYYFSATDLALSPNSIRKPLEGTYIYDVSRIKPTASFEAKTIQGKSDTYTYTYEIIYFNSTSEPTALIDSYTWDFGDGSPFATERNVTHQFTEPGTYTVKLKVVDVTGQWSETSVKFEITNSPPVAKLKTNPILVNSEARTVDLFNYIEGTVYEDDVIELDCTETIDKDGFVMDWIWTFGDGNEYTEVWLDYNLDGQFDASEDKIIVKTMMSPSEQEARLNTSKTGLIKYNYAFAGEYVITFTVKDNSEIGSDTLEIKVNVKNRMPSPEPGVVHIHEDGLTVTFAANLTEDGLIDSASDIATLNYTWDFGDGSKSHMPGPNHTFAKNGKYEIILKVRDDDNEIGTARFELDLNPKRSQDDLLQVWGLAAGGVFALMILIVVFLLFKKYQAKPEPKPKPEHELMSTSPGYTNADSGKLEAPESRHSDPLIPISNTNKDVVVHDRSQVHEIGQAPPPPGQNTQNKNMRVKDLLTNIKNK